MANHKYRATESPCRLKYVCEDKGNRFPVVWFLGLHSSVQFDHKYIKCTLQKGVGYAFII